MTQKPLAFVAELSGNHNGSLEKALEIVKLVSETGATHLKLQTYTADTITLPVSGGNFEIRIDHSLWGSRRLYDLYTEAHTPWEWHEPIFELARGLGLEVFSTPFDETAVEFLENLNVEMYKIASIEIVDIPLIKLVASTKKPIVISTGTASVSEIAKAVEAAREASDITLLVCTSSYPAKPEEANLARMDSLKNMFGVSVGLSDHTLGMGVSIAAVTLGASMIEKHVTISRLAGGVDSAFSMEPDEFKLLIESCNDASVAVGRPDAWRTESESDSLRLRPSLRVVRNVLAGETVSKENVRSVRPAGGLEPIEEERIIGRVFADNYEMGTPVTWEIFRK
jgi:N-acetylneuraminate synthase